MDSLRMIVKCWILPETGSKSRPKTSIDRRLCNIYGVVAGLFFVRRTILPDLHWWIWSECHLTLEFLRHSITQAKDDLPLLE